jgi:8-oxo-dGTP pyrophosphatase MutT (NUDIX family)
VGRSKAEVPSAIAHPLIARLAAALAGREAPRAERDEPFMEAAVALILRPRSDDDCDLLLIRRAQRAGDPWSGQIALPGGRLGKGDGSLEDTALRETREEVGLDLRADGVVLGALAELRPRTPVLPPIIVRPYVVALERPRPHVLNHEVAELRWVALGALLGPAARQRTPVHIRDREVTVDAIRHEDFIIWGMTERILSGLEALVR